MTTVSRPASSPPPAWWSAVWPSPLSRSPVFFPSRHPPRPSSTPVSPSRGGYRSSRWDSSPRPCPTRPGSLPPGDWPRGWRPSSRCSRCSPASSSPGPCSASSPDPFSSSAERWSCPASSSSSSESRAPPADNHRLTSGGREETGSDQGTGVPSQVSTLTTAQVEGGEVDSWDVSELYAASYRRLVLQLLAVTGDLADAEDAVQEAFVKAVRRSEEHTSELQSRQYL